MPKWFLGTVVEDVTVVAPVETVVTDQVDLVIGTMITMRAVARVLLKS